MWHSAAFQDDCFQFVIFHFVDTWRRYGFTLTRAQQLTSREGPELIAVCRDDKNSHFFSLID